MYKGSRDQSNTEFDHDNSLGFTNINHEISAIMVRQSVYPCSKPFVVFTVAEYADLGLDLILITSLVLLTKAMITVMEVATRSLILLAALILMAGVAAAGCL